MFRIIGFVTLLSIILQSCSKYTTYCGCEIQCASYPDHNIRVCSCSYTNASDYLNTLDSLQKKYPNESAKDTILTSVSVGEGHRVTDAETNEMNQLSGEGYVCSCITPE